MFETCWSNFKCFNVKKFYVCALVGVLIKCHYFLISSYLGFEVMFLQLDICVTMHH